MDNKCDACALRSVFVSWRPSILITVLFISST
ncbi:unnamed protein product [Callosobruchus maculatus]|uniref:Uncharacterized protein n=1 Tax=Callosobruchus maculatus TaxID=64391 RepID=A0A653DA15_CALMS|nr:unnamed protein product [Callosobruchus maculatus]